MVVVLVVDTALAGTYTAFPLLDTSRMAVELMAKGLAHSSEQGMVVVGEMKAVVSVGSSASVSRATQRLR